MNLLTNYIQNIVDVQGEKHKLLWNYCILYSIKIWGQGVTPCGVERGRAPGEKQGDSLGIAKG